MTSAEVILKANSGNIASPEVDLESLLFDEVIPEFLLDIGRVSWVLRRATATVAANARTFDLPVDCRRVEAIVLGNATSPLPYIGEDQARVFAAEANTTQGTPEGWYYTPDSNGNPVGRVKFDRPTLTDTTTYYSYRWRIATLTDLSVYFPAEFHVALVQGLKREIYLERWGVGDKRVEAAARKFSEWKERAMADRELAPAGNHVVRM